MRKLSVRIPSLSDYVLEKEQESIKVQGFKRGYGYIAKLNI